MKSVWWSLGLLYLMVKKQQVRLILCVCVCVCLGHVDVLRLRWQGQLLNPLHHQRAPRSSCSAETVVELAIRESQWPKLMRPARPCPVEGTKWRSVYLHEWARQRVAWDISTVISRAILGRASQSQWALPKSNESALKVWNGGGGGEKGGGQSEIIWCVILTNVPWVSYPSRKTIGNGCCW